jgi:pimeloyl-ACP methyl ester carboxylesterase
MVRSLREILIVPTVLLSMSAVAFSAAAAPASRAFSVNGVKIHYLVEGQGEPVVLIHGLHSSALMNWGPNGIMSELAKDHQVIALDLPGHGQSDKPNDEKAYGLQLVADVVALLDELKIKKAHIVGYSLGGMIAIKFLVMHPDRAISGTIGGMGWLRAGSRLERSWGQLPARERSRTPTVCVHSMGALSITQQELEDIHVSVEIVIGQRDPVKRMYVSPLQQVRPDWPIVEIEGAGHITCVTRPQFGQAVAQFVRKQTK